MAKSYTEKKKQQVVNFVWRYDQRFGRGGQAAAKIYFGINPISINKWMVEGGNPKPGSNAISETLKVPANLGRLMGSDLLVHGLDEFLATWLGEGSRAKRKKKWKPNELSVFEVLPPIVKEFYDCVFNWPTSKTTMDPVYRSNSLCVPKIVTGSPNSLQLVSTSSEQLVLISTDEDSLGDLIMSDNTDMVTPVDEFLVTFVLNQLVHGGIPIPDQSDKFPDSSCLFSGRYANDEKKEFYYHSGDRILWVVEGDNSIATKCVQAPVLFL